MIYTMKKVVYKAFGLTISGDFEFPELPYAKTEEELTDIIIIKADLSLLWDECKEPNRHFVVSEDFIMFQVPDVATYLIKNGEEIFVSPMDGSEEDQVRLFILGTCMGAVLLQRKILSLHGSAVVIDGNAYAIVGDSGAGKSTLASAFLKRGYHLLSDDVIPVTLSENNTPIVTPAYPQQKLWLESLNEFGMASDNLRPIINRESKYAVPVFTQFVEYTMPLAGIFELIKTESDTVEVHTAQKLEKLHMLFNHTYRNLFIERLGLMNWHFNITAKIICNSKVFHLYRPVNRFTAQELVDLILYKINEGEKVI